MNGIRVRHIVAGLVLLGGCDQPDDITPAAPQASTEKTGMTKAANPLRNAYFGDLHIHTTNSSDAYNVGVRATPEDAYRYAKGETVTHPLGYPMRLRGGALDFYGVTDHAENMGLGAAYVDPESLLSKHPLVIQSHTGTPKERQVAQMALASPNLIGKPVPGLDVEPVISAAWRRISKRLNVITCPENLQRLLATNTHPNQVVPTCTAMSFSREARCPRCPLAPVMATRKPYGDGWTHNVAMA